MRVSRGGFAAVSAQVEFYADFEEFEGGQHAGRLGPGVSVKYVERFLEPEFAVRRDGQGVPEVEGVVAEVVVGDAGVGVDDLDGVVEVTWINFGGDEGGLVAEGFGVEDGGDLADDAVLLEGFGAREDFGFGEVELLGDLREWAGDEGDLGLERVEELFVGGFHGGEGHCTGSEGWD